MLKSFRAVAVNGFMGSRLLRLFLSIVLAMSMFPASSAFANEVSLENDVEQGPETDASAEAVELTENGYIVDWTENGTCEWSIDAEGNMVIRPADGASVGELSGGFSCNSDARNKVKHIEFLGTVTAPKDSSFLFWQYWNVVSINLEGLRTSTVTNMRSMFDTCSSLTAVDLSTFDIAEVADMSCIFDNCSALSSVEMPRTKAPSLLNIGGMFMDCSSLASIDLSGFDTSKVTEMECLFRGCTSLTAVDLSVLDTSNLVDANYMFSRCSRLSSVVLTGVDTSKVTNIDGMFDGCSSLTSVDLSSFDTSKVTKMIRLFNGCSSLASIDLSSFDTSKVTEMWGMFSGCSALTSLDLSGLDMAGSMFEMFYGCTSLASVDLSGLDTSSVTEMREMFSGCSSLASVDLSTFDTSNVKYMRYMFDGCEGLRKVVVGEKFSFCGSNDSWPCSLPTPSGDGLSGKWVSSVDGVAYAADEIPNNVAATYTAEGWIDDTELDPSGKIPSSPFETVIKFNASAADEDHPYASTSVEWDDAWFNTSSYTYNHDLATTASVLSASAYTQKNIQEGLREKLGFDSYESEEYHPKNDYEGDYDQVGYSIETKTTGNGVPIIAIVVRGTPGNGEWLSNLNIDDAGKGFGQDTHEGFNKAAEKVMEAFTAYVKDNRINLDHARVLVTGHSRGASVANLIGARLDKGEGVDYSDGEVTGKLSADRIYTYTFESPEVTTSSDCDNSRYDNIYNIVNPEDVITRVPLSEATWGYNRYGKDLALPSKSNCSDDAYKALREKMGGYFYQFAGTYYANYKTGALTARVYSAEVLALAPFTFSYYLSNSPVSPKQFFDSIVRTVIMKEPSLFDTMIIAGALSVKPYQLITRTLLGTVAVSSRAELADRVVHGHTQEMYVAWMKSAADADPALGELPSIFTHSNYRTFSVACPVDVKAYDSEGNLVASIVDDQVDESLLENGIPAEVTSDGTKMIDLPADSEYHLEVTATDDGEMDVTIEENDGTGGDPLSVKCYQGISLDAGDSFTMEAPATSAPDDCTLVDGASGEEAQAGSIVSGSSLEKATVSVVAEGSGYAWGGGSVIKGGKMYVHAKASDLSTFVGWKCSYGEGSSDEIVSTDEDFEVRAAGDVTCTAVFDVVPATASERLYGETRYDTMTAISSAGFTCADSVILASGKNFPDALGASALAGTLNAPVLLTDPNALSDQAASEIERLGARTVYIVGGTAAVSSGVETDLRSKGYKVERIFGNSRQQTAVEVAKAVAGMASPDTAIVAAGEAAWDSLSVSPFAYAKGYPVYLAEKDGSVSQQTIDAIKASSSIKRIIIVGGNAAVSASAESALMDVADGVERWYGDSRYETSEVIAKHAIDEGMLPVTVAVASGENFPDALAGGALVGGRGGVLLLSPSSDGSRAARWMGDRSGEIGECYLLGGTAALSDDVQSQIDSALK